MARADIDLSALRANLKVLQTYLKPGTELLAAVKANAYGHGAVAITRQLALKGIRWFGVATAEEALHLRWQGFNENLLVFSPVYDRIEELIELDIALTVTDEFSLETVLRDATSSQARVHLKVDTGMARLGLNPTQALTMARAIDRSAGSRLEGVWTHLAKADEANREFTEAQLSRFDSFVQLLRSDGLEPIMVHAANSAGLITTPTAHFDMVRPGIALYGHHASRTIATLEPRLKPVMTLTAPVTFVKRVKAGTPVSYGGSWKAVQDTTIATVRIGYGDGYPRLLSNRGWVRLGDHSYPVVGHICMDQLMIDVGTLDLIPGDRVTLFGAEGPDAGVLAEQIGTISYELLTAVSARVQRRYLSTGRGTYAHHLDRSKKPVF
ncbi:MAG: alanine racemase [Trueperaceae bacterium]|nr:MAG: alanine racemase [Trueperaceae bacterium]